MTAPTDPATAAARRYHCPACGHMMLYGAARCDACNEEAPVYNRPFFWRLLWLSVVLVAVATGAFIASG